jgi:hypothetical protein
LATASFDRLEESVPNLSKKVLIPGRGHWIQQESPEEVQPPDPRVSGTEMRVRGDGRLAAGSAGLATIRFGACQLSWAIGAEFADKEFVADDGEVGPGLVLAHLALIDAAETPSGWP